MAFKAFRTLDRAGAEKESLSRYLSICLTGKCEGDSNSLLLFLADFLLIYHNQVVDQNGYAAATFRYSPSLITSCFHAPSALV